jgi:hypothetical protein
VIVMLRVIKLLIEFVLRVLCASAKGLECA